MVRVGIASFMYTFRDENTLSKNKLKKSGKANWCFLAHQNFSFFVSRCHETFFLNLDFEKKNIYLPKNWRFSSMTFHQSYLLHNQNNSMTPMLFSLPTFSNVCWLPWNIFTHLSAGANGRTSQIRTAKMILNRDVVCEKEAEWRQEFIKQT